MSKSNTEILAEFFCIWGPDAVAALAEHHAAGGQVLVGGASRHAFVVGGVQ